MHGSAAPSCWEGLGARTEVPADLQPPARPPGRWRGVFGRREERGSCWRWPAGFPNTLTCGAAQHDKELSQGPCSLGKVKRPCTRHCGGASSLSPFNTKTQRAFWRNFSAPSTSWKHSCPGNVILCFVHNFTRFFYLFKKKKKQPHITYGNAAGGPQTPT